MEPHLFRPAQYFRDEAARLRREADAITHQTIRRQILSMATDYDGLAKIVETINRQRGGG